MTNDQETRDNLAEASDDDGPCIACGAPHPIADSCLDGAGNPLDGEAGA